MWKEFKDFISRGNVMDLAVGVIIGGAFGNIVTSLVSDVLMPIVGILIGGHDFSSLSIGVGESKIMYGAFLQNILDFLIIAVCILFMIKLVNKLFHKKKQEKEAPKKSEETLLLEEIRDLLKEQQKPQKTTQGKKATK